MVGGRCDMKTLHLNLIIEVDGHSAADVAEDLAIDVDAGDLDPGALNMLRAHLRRMGDFRDYRIVAVRVTVPEVQP